jgi:hypothetical protein
MHFKILFLFIVPWGVNGSAVRAVKALGEQRLYAAPWLAGPACPTCNSKKISALGQKRGAKTTDFGIWLSHNRQAGLDGQASQR